MSWYYSYYQTSGEEIAEKAQKLLLKHPDYSPVNVSVRQGVCSSWWGKSWCRNLERYADWSNRVGRGKKYVRNGAVVDLKINGGKIEALVVGSRAKPYKVEITIKPLSSKQQIEIERLMTGKIQNLEALVEGNFPEELKDDLFREGIIFPEPDEIEFDCSCPDAAYMCKHVAAVLYGIGIRLDENPLYFFQMRGVNTDKFVANVVSGKVDRMLSKANVKTHRIIDDEDLSEMFALELDEDIEPSSAIEAENAELLTEGANRLKTHSLTRKNRH